MSKIAIEKGIPVPAMTKGAPKIYPFGKMKIGDSFFVPDVPKTFSIYTCVRRFNERNAKSIKVAQRRESNGVRVWRIA